jgi:hypothetical protein
VLKFASAITLKTVATFGSLTPAGEAADKLALGLDVTAAGVEGYGGSRKGPHPSVQVVVDQSDDDVSKGERALTSATGKFAVEVTKKGIEEAASGFGYTAEHAAEIKKLRDKRHKRLEKVAESANKRRGGEKRSLNIYNRKLASNAGEIKAAKKRAGQSSVGGKLRIIFYANEIYDEWESLTETLNSVN